MVTKQQQLEWLAENHESWPHIGPVMIMSDKSIGAYYGAPMPGCHFVSLTEWQQERDKMSSKPEIDNAWHERGELPPVGCECEAMRDGEWVTVEVLRHRVNNVGMNVAAVMNCTQFNVFWATDFRQLRTEREKAIDEMASLISKSVFGSAKCQAEKLYDAGYRKVNP